MQNKDFACKKFIDNKINNGICTTYEELSLPLYPDLYEIKTFCRSKNHQNCPILNSSTLSSLL